MITENPLFNLIYLYTANRSDNFSQEAHCEQKAHHDFYCEVEPLKSPKNIFNKKAS